jgi:hypothetical protein
VESVESQILMPLHNNLYKIKLKQKEMKEAQKQVQLLDSLSDDEITTNFNNV